MTQAPPSGMGTDGISDFQIPLDADRNYTLVVSLPEDRPANASEENGVAWLDWARQARASTTSTTAPTSGWPSSASCALYTVFFGVVCNRVWLLGGAVGGKQRA